MKKILITLQSIFCFSVLLIFTTHLSALSISPKKIIIDTDGGYDDYLGILYALTDPGVRVLGITVACTGEVECPTPSAGIAHILQLIDLAKPAYDVPVAAGELRAQGDYVHYFPQLFRDQADTLNHVKGVPDSDRSKFYPRQTAVSLLHQLIAQYPENEITVVALGPLTDFSDLKKKYGAAFLARVNHIVISGTAFGEQDACYDGRGFCLADGNVDTIPGVYTSVNPWAEWNMYADVTSAADILNTASRGSLGVPGKIILVPTEVTNLVPANGTDFQNLVSEYATNSNAAADLVYHDLKNLDVKTPTDGRKIWDATTTVAAIDIATEPKSVYEQQLNIHYYHVAIDVAPGDFDPTTVGRTQVVPPYPLNDENELPIGIVRATSTSGFVQNFDDTFWTKGINKVTQTFAVKIVNATKLNNVYKLNSDAVNVSAFGEPCAASIQQGANYCIHQVGNAIFKKVKNGSFHETFAKPIALSSYHRVLMPICELSGAVDAEGDVVMTAHGLSTYSCKLVSNTNFFPQDAHRGYHNYEMVIS